MGGVGRERRSLFSVACIVTAGLVVIAVGLALRSWNLQESLWVDELHTSWAIRGEGLAWINRAAWGNQPPLYFGLTKLWCGLCGESEASLRGVSWLAGVALVGLLAWIVFRLSGSPWLALVSLLAASIDVDLVFYAQEARPYASLQLIALVHFLCLAQRLRWLPSSSAASSRGERQRVPGGWRVGWIVSGWLAFYCHYTSLVLLAVDVLWSLAWYASWRWRCSRMTLPGMAKTAVPASSTPTSVERELMRLGVDGGWLLLGLLPAALHLQSILTRQSDWSGLMQTWPLPTSLSRVILLYALPLALILAVRGFRRFFQLLHRERPATAPHHDSAANDAQDRMDSHLWWLLMTGGVATGLTVLGLWAGTHYAGISWFLPRYLMSLLPLPLLGVGLVWRLVPNRRWRSLLVSAWIVLLLFENPALNAPPREGRRAIGRGENWRAAIASLATVDDSPRYLFLFSNLVEDPRLNQQPSPAFLDYMRFPVRGMYQLAEQPEEDGWQVIPRPVGIAPLFRVEDLRSLVEQGEAWLLIRGLPGVVADILDELAFDLRSQDLTFDAVVDDYGGVFVVTVRLRATEPAVEETEPAVEETEPAVEEAEVVVDEAEPNATETQTQPTNTSAK